MSFTIQLTGFTLGASILNVDLYGCTGSTVQCTGQTINNLTDYFLITGHTNIPRAQLNGRYVVVPNGIKTIKLVPSNLNDGGCTLGTDFNFIKIDTPLTPTPTVTPTATPTVTPTSTPTVTPTSTPICVMTGGSAEYTAEATPTPTPTPTITPTPTVTVTPTPTATVDGPTPTPTVTPTVTPTATPTPYYLQLQPCSQAPGSGIVWSRLAFIQSEIQVNDIFYSAGGYYYTVINYQQEQPNPIGTLDGTKASSEYRTCADTPGAYVPPPPTPGVGFLVYTGGTFSNSSEPCNTQASELIDQTATVFLSGRTTPSVDDYVYTTNVCVTTFVGNSTYYWAFASSTRYALKIGSNGQISEVVNCSNVPTFTPTPTPTITPTPTATPTPYYLQLQPCSQAPGTGIRWSRLAFIQSEIQVGDIFWSAGNAYYSVIGYQQEQPNPIGDIDGSKSTEYTTCSQTPFAYTPPLPTPGVSIAIYLGQTFGNAVQACGVNSSNIFTNYENVFLSGHTIPADGDYVYTTAVCNVVYVGNSSYYVSLANGTKYAFTIGGNGQIYNVTNCSNLPTDTPTPTPTATGTPTPTPTVTPTPTPTETPAPPTLYGLFRSDGVALFNGHCDNNYVINTLFYAETTSITNLLGTYVYSDTDYTPLNGFNLYYAIDSDGSTNTSSLPYYSLRIDSNGEVIDVQQISSCGGNGTPTQT